MLQSLDTDVGSEDRTPHLSKKYLLDSSLLVSSVDGTNMRGKEVNEGNVGAIKGIRMYRTCRNTCDALLKAKVPIIISVAEFQLP